MSIYIYIYIYSVILVNIVCKYRKLIIKKAYCPDNQIIDNQMILLAAGAYSCATQIIFIQNSSLLLPSHNSGWMFLVIKFNK